MDFDQRLDRLTERHEALAQSLELVVHMHHKNEEAHQKNEVLLEKSQILIVQVIESVDSLARIAHAHERRITNLEEGRP
jgi:hypothetical protein